MTTTVSVNEETSKILRFLSQKTKIDLIDIMDEISKQIKIMLEDGIEDTPRINFMVDADLKNSMVHLRFSPLYMGLDNLTLEQRNTVLKEFGYSQDGKFTDLREKKTDVDPIQQKPQPNPEEKKGE
jgi:hypothetical protein